MKFRAGVRVLDWKLVGILLSVLFYLPAPCHADITNDLKPIDGYVVKAGDDACIIDLDATSGIAVGDIFSVLGPGEELVHPITKKVIGKLDEVKAVLRVSRISEGFSFARPIGNGAAIKRGDPIRRYSSLKAVFWDYSDRNKPLFDRLQTTLPSLTWQDYGTSQRKRPAKPAPLAGHDDVLFFIVQNNRLEVRDAEFDLIRTYSLEGAAPAGQRAVPSPPVGTLAVPQPMVAPAVAHPVVGQGKPPVIDYGTADNIAGLDDNTLMADLLLHRGQRLLATTNGKKVNIFRVEDRLKPVTEGQIPGFGQILAVKWWQPEADGPLYLAVLDWNDDKIDSTIFALDNDRLTTVASGLDTILGSFDLDQDGRPETLLSQRFTADDFFDQRIKEMYWQNSRLEQKSISLQLPAKFTVIGGQLADLTGDGRLEAAYVRNGVLWIYSGKKRLYVSPKQLGGSLSSLTYKVDPTLRDFRSTSVFFEIAPVAADVDGDGRRELLAVSSDQSSIRAPGLMTTIDKSRISIFKYVNGAFVKGDVGEPVDGAIQGLAVDGRRVLFVVTDIGSPLAKGGSSRLRTLDLAP
jgi:hypothetical protein